jgi:hypothetical protein
MGSRYLFVVLSVLLEKWLTRGDYRRSSDAPRLNLDPAPDGSRDVAQVGEARRH